MRNINLQRCHPGTSGLETCVVFMPRQGVMAIVCVAIVALVCSLAEWVGRYPSEMLMPQCISFIMGEIHHNIVRQLWMISLPRSCYQYPSRAMHQPRMHSVCVPNLVCDQHHRRTDSKMSMWAKLVDFHRSVLGCTFFIVLNIECKNRYILFRRQWHNIITVSLARLFVFRYQPQSSLLKRSLKLGICLRTRNR